MKRSIKFYRTETGKCPVEEFLENLPGKVAQKVTWTLELIKSVDMIPRNYFKKLVNSKDIWECRVNYGSNIYRLFCFWDDDSLIILTHGLIKKTQKTPSAEIERAEQYKTDYFRRKNHG